MICSPRYLLVVYMWDIVGHMLFSGVYIYCTLGIVYSLFFSCNRTQCRGLGTNTCLYFDDCNLILVNHFVRAHRVGPCGAAAGAPVSSWFRSPNSRLALVRIRGPTEIRNLPDGGSGAREERTLQKMELVMAATGG